MDLSDDKAQEQKNNKDDPDAEQRIEACFAYQLAHRILNIPVHRAGTVSYINGIRHVNIRLCGNAVIFYLADDGRSLSVFAHGGFLAFDLHEITELLTVAVPDSCDDSKVLGTAFFDHSLYLFPGKSGELFDQRCRIDFRALQIIRLSGRGRILFPGSGKLGKAFGKDLGRLLGAA